MNLQHRTDHLAPDVHHRAQERLAQIYHPVSPDRPFQAGWRAYGRHRMYVGAFPSSLGDWLLLATDKAHEAAGFKTIQECESAMRDAGFMIGGGDHLEIGPIKGQMPCSDS